MRVSRELAGHTGRLDTSIYPSIPGFLEGQGNLPINHICTVLIISTIQYSPQNLSAVGGSVGYGTKKVVFGSFRSTE